MDGGIELQGKRMRVLRKPVHEVSIGLRIDSIN